MSVPGRSDEKLCHAIDPSQALLPTRLLHEGTQTVNPPAMTRPFACLSRWHPLGSESCERRLARVGKVSSAATENQERGAQVAAQKKDKGDGFDNRRGCRKRRWHQPVISVFILTIIPTWSDAGLVFGVEKFEGESVVRDG